MYQLLFMVSCGLEVDQDGYSSKLVGLRTAIAALAGLDGYNLSENPLATSHMILGTGVPHLGIVV